MKWGMLPLLVLLASCSNKGSTIGKYVYVDVLGTIHVARECPSALGENAKTKEERLMRMQGVDFVDTCTITLSASPRFCPNCVDDVSYGRIINMAKRNTDKGRGY